MKHTKRLYGTLVVLFAFLIFAFFYVGHAENSTKNKIPKVGVLQLLSHPALDQINKGLDDTLKKHGYVNGKNIQIIFQNAQGDQSNLRTISKQFVQDNVDVAVGIATPSVQSLKNATSTTPIVMGAVTDPKGFGIVKDNQHPGGNITGVSDQAPLADQLKLMKQIMPDLHNIGIIYTSSDMSATTETKKMKKLAEAQGIKVSVSSISNVNDLEQVSTSLSQHVQAIFVPTDNTIASGMKLLSSIAAKQNVPVFPAADTMVKDGGLATLGLSQYELGEKAGEDVVQILKHGKKPADMPITFIKKGHLIINEKMARKLNITFPDSVLKKAHTEGRIIK
ncbi:tryptophan ABC transporter substrate-binding protein [Companilactobacillus mishanensis]|uniref:ABC transporter substrate-binding protein n=1 Tax=Companilactobacillus mishanensis TaxID=2486008 RepID=A0A5P0ZIH6_9LACO|nr:tryptophan ABC transporter substrate-binding protein [Companilactobacillus mishanensis]MQS45852.1 ABC transporter substrate-binding protein [Companilactobacillus mishanensis]MQS52828.1 ABC transporter substrate-binding protein [Companilactobacillus mishanensis]MQS89917.1 ABC transporter substrate-binding protein [Companilactobacillus mishanensis]